MHLINWAIVFLGGTVILGILIGSLLRKLGTSYLDRAVAYHTRNMDTELEQLLHPKRDT